MSRYLVAGLGNPGPRYVGTRHNIGFRCAERVADAHGFSFSRRHKNSQVAIGSVGARSVILAKPRTFMNNSGYAVASLVSFYRVPLSQALVIYDDLDIPLGVTRLRPCGGAGGHRGMRSVIRQLGSREFARLRVGIGRPPGRMDPSDYVLQRFSADEEAVLQDLLDRVLAAIETWLVQGIDEAMSCFNRRA